MRAATTRALRPRPPTPEEFDRCDHQRLGGKALLFVARALGATRIVTAATGARMADACLGADKWWITSKETLDAVGDDTVDAVFDNYVNGTADRAMPKLRVGGASLLPHGNGQGALSKHPNWRPDRDVDNTRHDTLTSSRNSLTAVVRINVGSALGCSELCTDHAGSAGGVHDGGRWPGAGRCHSALS